MDKVVEPEQTEIRILIAEDDPAVAKDYLRIFNGAAEAGVTFRRDLDDLETTLFGGEPAVEMTAPRFNAIVCHQGDQAVAVHTAALQSSEPFDAALIDGRMPPGIDGIETARRLRLADPELLIGIVTGYSDFDFTEIATRIDPPGRLFFMRKPFEGDDIRAAVVRHMGRGGLNLQETQEARHEP